MNIRAIALVAAAAFVVLAGPSRAADLSKVERGRYVLDKRHARIVFSINHLGFSTYYGFFSDVDGNLDLDPASPAQSALSVTIDVAGIVTMDGELDAKLKSDAFFDVAKFPKAAFKSTGIELTGEVRASLRAISPCTG